MLKPRRILHDFSPSCPLERDTLHTHRGGGHISIHMQSVPLNEILRTDGTDSLIKDVFEALLRQSGALEELDGAYLLCNRDALLVREWLHAAAWVISECIESVSHSTVRRSRLDSMGVNG